MYVCENERMMVVAKVAIIVCICAMADTFFLMNIPSYTRPRVAREQKDEKHNMLIINKIICVSYVFSVLLYPLYIGVVSSQCTVI